MSQISSTNEFIKSFTPRIEAAYEICRDAGIIETPLLHSSSIDALTCNLLAADSVRVYFKAEFQQITGSFKSRGALNAVRCRLLKCPNMRGVVTHSSGNHGKALAWAAKKLKLPCIVVVPEGCPPVKMNGIKSYGAEIVVCAPTPADRELTCSRIAQELVYEIIPPHDHADTIAGQATIAVEMFKQEKQFDAILVPTSGGGLASGIALAAKQYNPKCKVFCVEPTGKHLQESLYAGKRMWCGPAGFLKTAADGIKLQQPGYLPFQILCAVAEKDVFTVTDEQMLSGCELIFKEFNQLVELSSGAGVGALMDAERARILLKGCKNIGIILCGGNVDETQMTFLGKNSSSSN